MLASEWPDAKRGLEDKLLAHTSSRPFERETRRPLRIPSAADGVPFCRARSTMAFAMTTLCA